MLESWVVLSSVRPNLAVKTAEEVLETSCNLAIAVNVAADTGLDTFIALLPIQKEYGDRFLLRMGRWRQSVEATNIIYGELRTQDPSKNIFCLPIPDDMRLRQYWFDAHEEGWFGAFSHCYDTLGISQDGIGVLVGNDGRSHCNVAGFAGLTAKFCDIYQRGWLLCPEYLHWYLDHELTTTASGAEKFYKCPGAQTYHNKIDDKKNQKTEDYAYDVRVYQRRLREGFPYNNILDAPWRYWLC